MERTSTSSRHPALLAPGTLVGPWRVVDWAGQGVHGAVYRAVRIGQEHTPPVALKLALLPQDPRFAREQQLLSRMLHPHIPRLVDHGHWQSPTGSLHPFLAMEWIDGVPLYDWARLFRPSAPQQLRLLAQLALTLHYLHAQGTAHRDLKGANLLVRRCDSRLFLTDFGSSTFPGADTLTPQQLPPGTPAYRSPEAWLFSLQFRRSSQRYTAGPADDVFALGVTACVLATGAYPEMGQPYQDDQGTWHLDCLVLPRALFSAQVAPPLRHWILRMLSLRPEQRGTAAQLAQALEQAADSLSRPRWLASASVPQPLQVLNPQAPAPSTAPESSRWPRLTLAAAAGALASWGVWTMLAPSLRASEAPRLASGAESSSDAGTVELGEEATSNAPTAPGRPPAAETMAAESPPVPHEGQAQPDKKGRCPQQRQVIFDGNCWGRMKVGPRECEDGGGQMYQGTCYVPVFPRGSKRPSTSSPGDSR